MFRAIKEHGETPQTLYKNFGIRGKIRAMNEEDLLKDGNFMLWREFAGWWGKNGKNV
ncbi:Avirulence (Avh) protein [Phytophthora megakarya]|uniref:Avirulence (Avh) protein n=1 Tax=Phytophthora megakarya TaxID=4795 RepID=A0A225VJD6_9STRA|nr:Avirulence (Avh) protein [Phytophthora megakarya]